MNVKIFVCVYSNELKKYSYFGFWQLKKKPTANKAGSFESLTGKFITQNLVDEIVE